ncbi:unnamed protein product [Diplocarpon coronariae]
MFEGKIEFAHHLPMPCPLATLTPPLTIMASCTERTCGLFTFIEILLHRRWNVSYGVCLAYDRGERDIKAGLS